MAAGHTTGVTAPAADEVSMAISAKFGSYGQDFQVANIQAFALLHNKFLSILNGTTDSTAQDVGTEDNQRGRRHSTPAVEEP